MRKVDFNFQIKDPSGQVIKSIDEQGREIPSESAAKILSNIVGREVLKDENKIVKYFGWSTKLATVGVLELDKADEMELKKFIIENPTLFVISKAQLLEAFSQPPAPGTKPKG